MIRQIERSMTWKPPNNLSAKQIEKGLQKQVIKFAVQSETTEPSSKTILHHHRLISTILAQAARDRLVPFNVAEQDDIDYENKVIHIRRTSQYVSKMGIITKDTKNDSSERTIKLSEGMFSLLREYKEHWDEMRRNMGSNWQHFIEIKLVDGTKKKVRNERLFIKVDSTPMNPDSLTDWTKKFVKRNNLPHFSPHSLRHTHATLLIASGVNIPTVSMHLGHSSIATTTKTYIHAIQSADEIASKAIEDKLDLDKRKIK